VLNCFSSQTERLATAPNSGSCVRRAPALVRGRFHSRPRRFCSQPSWRRRVGPAPGGHRFGRRLISGNKAAQPVPIEPFVPKTPENGIFVWQSVGPFKPNFNRDKYATSSTAHRVTAAQRARFEPARSDNCGVGSTDGLIDQQRQALDQLLEVRVGGFSSMASACLTISFGNL